MEKSACTHLASVRDVRQPERRVCQECVKAESEWVHLRTCQTCGITLCCDSSPMRHASAHARASAHSVIASAEVGERWLYCYVDEMTVRY
jgi:hypothetical protein